MSLKVYQDTILKRVTECDLEHLNSFCADVVGRILDFVDDTAKDHLNDKERVRIDSLIQQVKSNSINWLETGNLLDELTQIAEEDDEHAIEMEMEFVEFLCVMDNWRILLETGNKEAAKAVSENLMNILDYRYVESTSLEEWLSVDEVYDEFEKQKKFLSAFSQSVL
ncbi:hypothetical protein [Aliikangiella coralliicola]|uniref:Uncharacterized protein n=1 Tax=Aliikangiella coralliicola TaxID=2592383 RepID=A0A545TSQ3_9GAMM|nr:hypothetical protein [Aliikangiella coralliicola]TQV80250.1 hypothetical protein FLL46_26390 [Aliikangiella coralliicola]